MENKDLEKILQQLYNEAGDKKDSVLAHRERLKDFTGFTHGPEDDPLGSMVFQDADAAQRAYRRLTEVINETTGIEINLNRSD